MFSRRFENFDRDVSVTLLPRCLSNFRAMGQFKHKSCGFGTSRDLTMRRLIRVQLDIETGSKPCHGGP